VRKYSSSRSKPYPKLNVVSRTARAAIGEATQAHAISGRSGVWLRVWLCAVRAETALPGADTAADFEALDGTDDGALADLDRTSQLKAGKTLG
jgi:hypothetical protein